MLNLKEKFFVPIVLVLSLLSSCSNPIIYCNNCSKRINEDSNYCQYCGTKLIFEEQENTSVLSDENAIVGTWTGEDPGISEHSVGWGSYKYIFYSDGYCQGYYYGNTGGVEPSLHPQTYYTGSGNGYWSFVDGKLKVEYTGESKDTTKGTQYYDYEFNEDYSKLTIYGPFYEMIWIKTEQ